MDLKIVFIWPPASVHCCVSWPTTICKIRKK